MFHKSTMFYHHSVINVDMGYVFVGTHYKVFVTVQWRTP
jgi:hypothetical protein